MIVDTKPFFQALHTHHQLPPDARPADLTGRLSIMADPEHSAVMRVTPLTRRCLALFLRRCIQPSSSNQGVA